MLALAAITTIVVAGVFTIGFYIGKANAQGTEPRNNFQYTTDNGQQGYSVYCYTDSVWDWEGCVKEDGTIQFVKEYNYIRSK